LALLKSRKLIRGTSVEVSKYLGDLASEIAKAFNVPPSMIEISAIIEGKTPVLGIASLKLPKVIHKKGIPLEEGYGYVLALIIDGKLYPNLGLAIEAVYPELVAAKKLGVKLPKKAAELLEYIENILDAIATPEIRKYLDSVANDVYQAWKEAIAEGKARPEEILHDIEVAMPSDEEIELLRKANSIALAEAI